MSEHRGPIEDHPLDDLAVYALDALDGGERRAIDDHLARCPTCRYELAGHHETLATLTSDEAPPAVVWQRVAASIGGVDRPDGLVTGSAPTSLAVRGMPAERGPASFAPTGEPGQDAAYTPTAVPSLTQSARHARARRASWPRWAAAAACLAIAATAGGVFGFALGRTGEEGADIGRLAERASEEPDGVLATLADTGGQPVARLVADEDGAYMVLEGLQDLPEGQAYQLWSLDGPEPVSLGMLGRDGTNTVAFRLPPTISKLAISAEPTNGEVAPSGPFHASGNISDPAAS